MKKLLILTILGVFTLGSMAYATQTRVTTMGEADMIVKDEANVMWLPQTITMYPKLVGACVSGGSLSDFYGHMMFQEESDNPLVFGLYFYNYDDDTPYGTPSLYFDDEWALQHNRLDIVFGTKMGESPIGVGLEYDQASTSMEGDSQEEQSFFRLGLTFGATMMENKLEAGAKIRFASWTNKDYDGEESTQPDGDMMLALYGRYWMDPMGKWTPVPHFAFMMNKEGVKGVETNDKYSETMTGFDLGLGMNYDAGQDVMMVTDFGFNFQGNSYKSEPEVGAATENKEGWFILPYFRLGVDAKVFKWMDFRGGVVSEWESYTWEPETGDKEKYSQVDTRTYLGAGFHWGNFMIDVEVHPEFLENGPYFLSGERVGDDYYGYPDKAPGDGIFSNVNLIYWFD
jgi:hypothetical protein